MNLVSAGNEIAEEVQDASSWKQLHGSRCHGCVWSCESSPAVFMRGLSSNACRFWSPSWYVQSTGQLYLAAHSSTISTKLNFNSKKTSLQQAFKFKRCYISAEVIFFLNKWNVFFITLMDKWVLLPIYIVHHEASLTLDHIWMLTGNWSFSSQKETYLWSSEPNPTPAITAVQKEYDTLFPFVYFLFWVKWFFFPENSTIIAILVWHPQKI